MKIIGFHEVENRKENQNYSKTNIRKKKVPEMKENLNIQIDREK